jgi:glutamyl/glutaminyl-tRNA synthetase
VHLRIEDHDRERCRPEYEAGILEDLAWLGYRPDFPLVRHPNDARSISMPSPSRKSQGLVYALRLHAQGDSSTDDRRPKSEVRRRAQVRRLLPRSTLAGRGRIGWRVRIDPGAERFVDQLLGPQDRIRRCKAGDVLMRDRARQLDLPARRTVDDLPQGIDLVIRGEDLLASTGARSGLARLLGRETPATFLHHHLLMKSRPEVSSQTAPRSPRLRHAASAEDVKRQART